MRKRRGFRSALDRTFNDPTYPVFESVNDALALITIVSIAALVLETVPALSVYAPFFLTIEFIAVVIFTGEYLLRLMSAPHPFRYAFSFFGIIDLLAIVPSYLGMNFLGLKSARILRILRFLRLLRLAKLARLQTSGRKKPHDLEDLYRINIGIYCFAVVTLLLLIGTLMHLAEGPASSFTSIPFGMLWTLEVMVDSSAVIVPNSALGQSAEVFARFMSFVLLGFLIHIVGGFVNTMLLGAERTVRRKAVTGEEV